MPLMKAIPAHHVPIEAYFGRLLRGDKQDELDSNGSQLFFSSFLSSIWQPSLKWQH